MPPAGMVSVCPLCVMYHKCVFSPCLYPKKDYVPFIHRMKDYADIAEFCYLDKMQSPENGHSGEKNF